MKKDLEKYFSKHVFYNGIIHVIGGVGIGILITYPYIGQHPVRWGIALLLVALFGHLYPLITKGNK